MSRKDRRLGVGSDGGPVGAGRGRRPWGTAAALALAVLAAGSSDAAAQAAAPGQMNGAVQAAPRGAAAEAGRGAAVAAGPPARSGALRCETCHALPNLGYDEMPGAAPKRFTVAPATFRASAHGKLSCTQCHPDIATYPHAATAPRKPVSCDADCHATDARGRPYTHAAIAGDFRSSVHAKRPSADDPTCLTCHGAGDAHAIVPVARVSRPAKMALCVRCHDDAAMMKRHEVSTEAVASYRRSFHYKGIRFGDTRTAICSDCHTAHLILPASEAASSVAPAALTRTCGQANCHQGAERNFAVSGANHLDLRIEKSGLLWFEEKFFYVLTGGTMLMLLAGIVLDVQRKFGWLALALRLVWAVRRRVLVCRPTFVRRARRGARFVRQLLLD